MRTHRWNSDSVSPAVDVVVHSKPQVARTEPGIRYSRRQWWTGRAIVYEVDGQNQVRFEVQVQSALMAAHDEGRHVAEAVAQGQGLSDSVALCGARTGEEQHLRKGPTRPPWVMDRGTCFVCTLLSYKIP
jgi:hypothetical protein